jgi:tetratricopeptide (TPR) repeat protein
LIQNFLKTILQPHWIQFPTLLLVILSLWGCASFTKNSNQPLKKNTDGSTIETKQPNFTSNPNKLTTLIQANLLYPQGLNLYSIEDPHQKNFLQRASNLYDSIAKEHPEDYFSAMRATELSILLQNTTLTERNASRFVKRTQATTPTTLSIQANYYNILVGLTLQKKERAFNSYVRLKEQNVDLTHQIDEISQWLTAMPYPTKNKIALAHALYLDTTDTLWIAVMVNVGDNHISTNEKLFIEVSEKHSDLVYLQWSMARYYLKNHSLDKAAMYLKRLINLDNQHFHIEERARKLLASYYVDKKIKQEDKALEHANWLKKNSSQEKSWAHYFHAITLLEHDDKKHYPKILSEFKQIQPSSPYKKRALYYSSYILYSQTKYEEALEISLYLDKSHRPKKADDPTQYDLTDALRHDISYLLSKIYDKQGKRELALKTLEKRLELYGGDLDSLYFQGMLNIFLKQFHAAEKLFKDLVKIYPDNAEVLNSLGYILTDNLNKFDEAKPLLEKAYRLSPKKAHILDSLGWLYFHLKKYDKAIDLLTQALELRNDPEVLSHLSIVLWESGKKKKATELLKKGLKDFPKDIKIQKLQKRLISRKK